MIFHICPPDTLFVQSLIDRFENVRPGFNRCVVIVSRHHKDSKINLRTNLIEYLGPLNEEIIYRINKSECHGIVIHTINDDILELSLNLSRRFPIIWKSWGPDLHNVLYPDFNLLLPYTQNLVSGRNETLNSIINFIRPIRNQVIGRNSEKRERRIKKLEFLKRIDFIATVTQTEYKMLQKQVPEMKANFLPLNYRSLDINKLPELKIINNFDNAMIGHSSFSYHNHADVFYMLNNESYHESLTVPLGYGDPVYKRKIITLGDNLFKNHINFLTDLLKFEDYLEIINHCSAFILNSKIQSGGGNILYFLYQGDKVYLREENPFYTEYKGLGIKIFSIQKELSGRHLLQCQISSVDKVNNRKTIGNLFNTKREKENVINAYKAFNISA